MSAGRWKPRSSNEHPTRSRWLLLGGFGTLLVAVAVLLRAPTANGFELSPYAAYPGWFWGLLVITVVLGQLLILREAFAEKPHPPNWYAGFLLSFLVTAILVFLPLIRGYPLYGRGDVLTHIGHVQTIHTTGGSPFQNIYQNLHQLVLALSYATGLEPMQLVNAVAGVISLFAIVASYALLSAVFERRRMLFTLPFVVLLIAGSTHLNPSPYAQSVLLVPFVLYLFARAQQTDTFAFRLPLAVAVIAVVLYHPLTAVFLLVVFGVHYVVAARHSGTRLGDVSTPLSRVTATSVLQLALVTFLAWYYNFVGIFIRFETVARRLLDPGEGETELDTYGQTILEFSPSLLDLAEIGFVNYGQRAIWLALGSLFVVGGVLAYARGKQFESPYLLTFGLAFVAFVILGVVFLFVDLIGGFGRPLVFAHLFAALVAGTLLASASDVVDRRAVVTVAVTLFLVVLAVSTVVTLYPSPMSGDSTSQVTQHDLAGGEWYFDNDLQDAPLQEYGTGMQRFEHALAGGDPQIITFGPTAPPERFNYTQYPTLGDSYYEDQYLVVTERGRQFYPATYPDYRDFWRFQPGDFERLEYDPTVSHVYTTEEFDVYLVTATRE